MAKNKRKMKQRRVHIGDRIRGVVTGVAAGSPVEVRLSAEGDVREICLAG